MNFQPLLVAAALTSALSIALPAQASPVHAPGAIDPEYSFSFVSTDFSGYSATGVVSTLNVLNTVGGYDITGITGQVFGPLGGTISSLVPNSNQPNPTTGNTFLYDNVAFAAPAAFVDTNGVLFKDANGALWNFYSTSSTAYVLAYSAHDDGNYALFSGTLSVSPVPEPSSAALIGAGLLVIGLTLRRRG